MYIRSDTAPETIAELFEFDNWEWGESDSSRTTKEFCVDSAALAVREALTNQNVSFNEKGVCIATDLEANGVGEYSICWERIIEMMEGDELEFADLFERIAARLRKAVNEPSPQPQQAQAGQ